MGKHYSGRKMVGISENELKKNIFIANFCIFLQNMPKNGPKSSILTEDFSDTPLQK